jgi:LPXTG-motif cell wall-anchored protein
MPPLRRLAIVFLVALGFGAPAPALAQTPGDEQYQDPFGGSQPAPDDAPTSDGDDGPAAPEPAPAPAPVPATAPPAAETAAPLVASQSQLPYTGADAEAVMAAGLVLLAGGVALRVRLRDPA